MQVAMQAETMSSLFDKAREWLKSKAEEVGGRNLLATILDAKYPTLSKVLTDDTYKPNAKDFLGWLERLGVRIEFPGDVRDSTRQVQWINPQIVESGKGAHHPEADNYLAVPLVGEVGAGAGVIPQGGEPESWVLVYANHRSVMRRRNLLAVKVEDRGESMKPTVHPGDIVLVDLDDVTPDPSGKGLFLVREPGQDGGGKVKRVLLSKCGGRDLIIFSSDNKDHIPEPHDLAQDYDGEPSKAIVGRVVWAWSDMTRK